MRRKVSAAVLLVAWASPVAAQPALDLHGDPLPPGAIARIGTVRWNHPGVHGLAYLGDGRQLLSWSSKELRWWDCATGKMVRRAECPNGNILICQMLADGRVFACTQSGNKLAVCDAANWKSFGSITLPGSRDVQMIAVSPTGKFIAVGLDDNRTQTVLLWKSDDSKSLLKLQPPKDLEPGSFDWCYSLAFAGDEVLLASWRYALYSWSVKDGKLLGTVPGAGLRYGSLAVSPTGQVVAWYDEPHLRFFDTHALKELCPPREVEGGWPIAFSPDGHNVVFGLRSKGGLLAWKTGKTHELDLGYSSRLAFSPDGKVLAFASNHTRVLHIDVASGKRHDAMGPSGEDIDEAQITPDGLWVATRGPRLHFWEAATGKHVARAQGSPPSSIIMSADGKVLAGNIGDVVSVSNDLAVWQVPSGKLLRSAGGTDTRLYFGLGFDADGKLILGGGFIKFGGEVKYLSWDWKGSQKNGQALTPVELDARPPFTNVAQPWVSVQDGRATWFTNARGARLCRSFVEPPESQLAFGCSPCGRWAMILFKPDFYPEKVEFRVGVVETATGRLLFSVGDGFSEVSPEVALLSDGKLLVLDRNGLSVHASGTGKVLTSINGHDGRVTHYSLSRDSNRLVTVGDDGTALVWDVPALIAKATPAARPVGQKELECAWADLGDADAARAGRAIELLAGAPV